MKIIMDQQKQIKSIEDVQEAEELAAKKLADAQKEKDRMIEQSKDKASAIVLDAIAKSKEEHESKVSKFTIELENEKKRAIEKALKESKSIGKKRLSDAKRAELVNSLVKVMVGE
jgi:F0F1-type ATP synthase membrane subunit b/b'